MDVMDLLDLAVRQGASDLHLSAGLPPMLRIDGDMHLVDMRMLSSKTLQSMIYALLNETQQRIFTSHMEYDFALDLKGVARFRVNLFRQNRGIGAVFRLIPEHILSLKDLRVPPIVTDILNATDGLCLITGATGSGKSTTLAAMVDHINRHQCVHILTIEDPIEFVHIPQRSLINQREVTCHTKSFESALRASLREDPDVILVGEMRDLETIRLALTAAETGHLVLATMHTNSATKAIDRMIDVFPAAEKDLVRAMLSESLRAVISQRLFKRRGGQGRVAGYEVMVATPAIRNLIREHKIAQMYSVMQTGQTLGMQTMMQGLQKLVAEGLVSEGDIHL